MDSHQISHALKSRHDVPPNIFKGTYALNQLPSTLTPPFGLVFNTEPLPLDGQHWIALFCPTKGIVEYFDTSGNPPLDTESLRQLKLAISSREGCRLIFSNRQIQNMCTSVCGEYCVLFLYCRMMGMSFIDFLCCFSDSKLMNNDVFVYSTVHSLFDIPNRERLHDVIDEHCLQSARALKSVL